MYTESHIIYYFMNDLNYYVTDINEEEKTTQNRPLRNTSLNMSLARRFAINDYSLDSIRKIIFKPR